jgi:hypothetical protein
MRNILSAAALAALVAVPLIAGPTAADAASCHSRKTTGTILGGVGGALLGNAVSHGGGGAVIGGLGGAVVGHEIGKGGCGRYTRQAYYSPRRTTHYRAAAPRYSNRTYYDERGRPVVVGGGYYR